MTLILSFVVLSGIGSCLGGSIPSFDWVTEDPPNPIPLLKISFPDGSVDFAQLEYFNPIPVGPNERAEDVDSCIYHGYLKHETTSYVTVTGCVYSNTFSVQFQSSHLENSMFEVADWQVKEIVAPLSRSIKNNDGAVGLVIDETVQPDFEEDESQERVSPIVSSNIEGRTVNPLGYRVPLKIRYDENFAAKFGSDAANAARRVMAHVQNLWKSPDLKTSMTFDINESVDPIPGKYNASSGLSDVSAFSTDGSFRSNIYLSFRNNKAGVVGMAWIGTVCSSTIKLRSCIGEWYQNDMTTGWILSHETGHNFNMNHIGKTQNSTVTGLPCQVSGSIMRQTINDKYHWSPCSVEALHKYINSFQTFCLTPNS